MQAGKWYLVQKGVFPVFISALICLLICLNLANAAFGAFSDRDAEDARVALERLGRVYISTNDVLKLANEIDPSTKLPYADTLSFLILASNAQKYLQSQDYGKLLGESASFVAQKAVGNAYPFASPFLMLGELYYNLFKKIAGIPQQFENAFFKLQISKYLSLRGTYDARSVREFALDSPLGLADDRAKGYFFASGLAGSTSTQVNLALRLRDNGVTPEVIFDLGETFWALQQKLQTMTTDQSMEELAQRIVTGSKLNKSPSDLQEFGRKAGVEWWPSDLEFQGEFFVKFATFQYLEKMPWRGKILGFTGKFLKDVDVNSGLFEVALNPLVIRNVPRGRFRATGEVVVLAARVDGVRDLPLSFSHNCAGCGGLTPVPVLDFIAVASKSRDAGTQAITARPPDTPTNLRNVIFQSNNAELTADGEPRVAQIASILNRTSGRAKISVEGHASRDEINQQQLSEMRAGNVARALVNHGVDRSRITARGLGSRAPIASNQTEAGRRQNRRVEIIIENR